MQGSGSIRDILRESSELSQSRTDIIGRIRVIEVDTVIVRGVSFSY